MCLDIAFKQRIAHHLKQLKESVPILPICTCDTMQDLPLRPKYSKQLFGEVRNKSLDYLQHIYNSIAFTSPLERVKLKIDGHCILNLTSHICV